MKYPITAITLAILSSACSDGGVDAGSAASSAADQLAAAAEPLVEEHTVRFQAEIRLNNVSLAGGEQASSNMVGVFVEFPNTALSQLLIDGRTVESGCRVSRQTATEIAEEEAARNAQYPMAVLSDAGNALPVSAPSGSWSALTSTLTVPGSYLSDWDYVGQQQLPRDSTLHIPGNDFPAIDEIKIPFSEPLTGVSFSDATGETLSLINKVTPETSVAWDAAPSDSNSRMLLSFKNIALDETGTLSSLSKVTCNIDDNGSFNFSAEIQALMDANYQTRSLIRFNETTEKRDDILIYVRSQSLGHGSDS